MRYLLVLALLSMLPLTACSVSYRSSSAHVKEVKVKPPKGKLLVSRIYIEADYQEVWDQIASKQGYSWYSAPVMDLEARVGGKISFGQGDQPIMGGKIKSITYGKGLAHSFRFSWVEKETSTVSYEIVAQGDVVRVEVVHDCLDAPETAKVIGEWGWQKNLSRLKTLVETGELMPWPKE